MLDVEREAKMNDQDTMAQLRLQLKLAQEDIYHHEFTAEEMMCELENLININEMYKDNIKALEKVIEDKNKVIQD